MRLPIIAAVLTLASEALGASNSTDASNSSYIDPIENFCQRLWHQSVVKNDILYIDGGLEVFVTQNWGGEAVGTPILGYNEYLITVPMNASWNWKTNISVTALEKPENPNTGTPPPNNVRGALYAGAHDDPNFYIYGGTVSWANTSFPGFQWPTSGTYALWGYDTSDGSWDQHDVSLDIPYRPAGGAYAESIDHGLAFYLGGFLDNGSSSDYIHYSKFKQYLNGLVVLNTTTKEANNISTSSLKSYPRAQGGLAHIPNLGPEGILVSIGGMTEEGYVSLDTVEFLDIASIDLEKSTGTWYSQATTGNIPEPRADFCVIAVSAPDNSSHHIYMYGGMGENGAFDQTYVLSLPSFRWIKLLEGESQRYGHTCHLVDNSQMLTVGGARYKNISEGCDWEMKSVAVLNLNDTTWGSVFAADTGQYTVPSTIYRAIGGSAAGNATEIRPSAGFSSKELASFFNQPDAFGESVENSHPLSGGRLAGVVVGSVAGAGVIVAGLAISMARRKKQRKNTRAKEQKNGVPETSMVSNIFTKVLFRNRGRRAELDPGSQRYEMEGPVPQELEAQGPHEMDGGGIIAELPERRSEDKKD